jgi:UDP-glucuronate 4-epimerase
MKILVTGTAGFIGSHLAIKLLEQGHEVTGIDNINSYYSPELKFARLKEAGISGEASEWNKKVTGERYPGYSFIRMNLESKKELTTLFEQEQFDMVCNLAAQAGVRYSIENPDAYISSNIVGFMNILEACRNFKIKHLVYASSSSVYGNSKKMPLSVSDTVDHPISLYAATKKSNELMAHTYSHLYGIPTTGLRFFTVYGPWGRPDMAYFLFTKAIIEGKPIQVFNQGDLYRDFTYIDDIVDGIINILKGIPDNETPYRIYNIGNSSPVKLLDFIETIENALGKKAVKNFTEMQPGDVYKTFADVSDLEKDFSYFPDTPIHEGINRFIQWYLAYYKVDIRNNLSVQG